MTKTKSEVIVAEMLPGQGSMALELGLAKSNGLVDLLSLGRVNELTSKKVEESLVQHGSGLKVLPSSDRPRDMHLINQVSNYEALVSKLSKLARFTVLDLGLGIQPFANKLLPVCDEVLIVLEGTPNTITHTKALIEDITSMGVNKRIINVILNNRIRSDTQLASSEVKAKLNHEIIGTLTPAPELFSQATRMQTPAILCQPDSITTRQIGKLVDSIAEREVLPR
jgi:MinD-like ATPase involved in chromosome partitioning or flagellar assembly